MTSSAPRGRDRFDLTGKVALVTGGSRGLGRATVLGFAEAGADVVVAARTEADCVALAAEAQARFGVRAMGVGCHVGRWSELDALVEAAYGAFGRVDVLVNNAGMSPLYDRVTDVSEELWRKVLDVNLSGPFRLTATIGSRMAEGSGGSIINVSSLAAEYPLPGVIPYAAAKAGVDALTLGFARTFGPTVRVNSVRPGTFFSDVSKHWDMEQFAHQARGFMLKRGAEPEEIVGTMLYLASDASSYTTGAILRVDGGYQPPSPV